MKPKDLVEKLNFEGDSVFLDGNKIFSVPLTNPSESMIRVLGLEYTTGMPGGDSRERYRMFVGSGVCCYGPISILEAQTEEGETPKFKMRTLRIPDFNVHDIIPVCMDVERSGFPTEDAVLVTGNGCAGSGVRLISTYYPKTRDVVSANDYRKLVDPQIAVPRLNVNSQRESVTLDFMEAGYRLKAGASRDPTLPRIVLDEKAQEWHVSSNICASMDLTPVLRDIGVDVRETLEANKEYRRIRK